MPSTDQPIPSSETPGTGVPLADRVRALAEEAAADTGLYIVEVEVRGHPGSRVVAVYVESETGAGADDLARLSRSLSFLLDTEDLVKGRYRLDVSTPGAERPLADRRQYRRHVGRTLEVAVDGEEETETLTGELQSVTDEAIVLGGADGDATEIPFDSIRDARVKLPW